MEAGDGMLGASVVALTAWLKLVPLSLLNGASFRTSAGSFEGA